MRGEGKDEGENKMDKKRILLVDDEAVLVETVKYRLEASGYEVIPAYDTRRLWRKPAGKILI